MFGTDLVMARNRRRTELRREARARLDMTGQPVALDEADLVHAASVDCTSWLGNTVKRALIVRGLRRSGIPADEIAAAWGVTLAEVETWNSRPLVDTTGVLATIERQVEDEIPETAEPGRVVAPGPGFAFGDIR